MNNSSSPRAPSPREIQCAAVGLNLATGFPAAAAGARTPQER